VLPLAFPIKKSTTMGNPRIGDGFPDQFQPLHLPAALRVLPAGVEKEMMDRIGTSQDGRSGR